MKVSELSGTALDWAVAKAQELMPGQIAIDGVRHGFYSPSTNWAIGGPIIEREGISLKQMSLSDSWVAKPRPTLIQVKPKGHFGDTALTAAMRCFVATKLGADILIPVELI